MATLSIDEGEKEKLEPQPMNFEELLLAQLTRITKAQLESASLYKNAVFMLQILLTPYLPENLKELDPANERKMPNDPDRLLITLMGIMNELNLLIKRFPHEVVKRKGEKKDAEMPAMQ